MTTVVVSPHLDDAVLAAWSRLGPDTIVVNCFCAPPPDGILALWDRLTGATSSRERAEERLREDVAALSSFGGGVLYLDFLDSSCRKAVRETGRHVAEPVPEQIAAGIVEVAPDGALVLGPLAGSDRPNPDHVIARDAVRMLRHGWYGQAPLDAALYADFPHVCKARGAWPVSLLDGARTATVPESPAIVDVTSDEPRWVSRLKRDLAADVDPLWATDVRILNPAERVAKRAAMEGYRTQFRALDTKLRTKGIVSNPALYGVEVTVPLL